jgi:hypothetical protein
LSDIDKLIVKGTKDGVLTYQEINDMISEDIANLKANDFYKITDVDTGTVLFE